MARKVVLKICLASALTLTTLVGHAGPVCAPPVPTSLCGGRIFAEPLQSVGGLTHREMVAGLSALAAAYPEWVRFEEFGQGSADGNPLYFVEITSPDPTIPMGDRKIVLVNQSIHGNEPGGREGAVRYAEDLVTGRDPARTALLDRVRLVQTFINPDGWTAGDHDHLQTGGGALLWARQNGAGPITGASDLGLGVDLNRQAPWRGISHASGPVSQPESIAFAAFVKQLAAEGDIQTSTDIHGEITDAAAWVMLSAGQFTLDQALNQRYHGEAIHAAIEASLEGSTAGALIEAVNGDVAPTVLTASSEFGSIAGESTASGTGFQGDWMAQPEGGGSMSVSTIELYNFIGSPGASSLTARPEVMQYYRDTVRGILGGLIDQAAIENRTRLAAGRIVWLDDAPRVPDPVRSGVTVSSADFFRDLAPQLEGGGLSAASHESLAEALRKQPDSLIITTNGLLAAPNALSAVAEYLASGGNVVLTDSALALLPALLPAVNAEQISIQLDDGGKVSYDRSHPLTAGIRAIGWLNTETATMGLKVEGGGSNVPTWRIEQAAWEAAGGSTAGISGEGQTSVGDILVGAGRLRIIGVLLPTPDHLAENIRFGINGYGVLDTGYIVLANALDGRLIRTVEPAVASAGAGRVTPVLSGEIPGPARGGGLGLVLLLLLAAAGIRRRR